MRKFFRYIACALMIGGALTYYDQASSTQSVNTESFKEYITDTIKNTEDKDTAGVIQNIFNRYMTLYSHSTSQREKEDLDNILQVVKYKLLSDIPILWKQDREKLQFLYSLKVPFFESNDTLGGVILSEWNKLFNAVINNQMLKGIKSKIDSIGNIGIIRNAEYPKYLLILQSGLNKDVASVVAHIASCEFQQFDIKFVILSGLDIILACQSPTVDISFVLPSIGCTVPSQNEDAEHTYRAFLRGLQNYYKSVKNVLCGDKRQSDENKSGIKDIPDQKLIDDFIGYLNDNLGKKETKRYIDDMKEKLCVKSLNSIQFDALTINGDTLISKDNAMKIIKWFRYALHTEVQAMVLTKINLKIQNEDIQLVTLDNKNVFYSLYSPCHSCMQLNWIDSADINKTPFAFYKKDSSTTDIAGVFADITS